MTSPGSNQQLYEELAERYGQKREARQRDIFLVLAADAAHAEGNPKEAERLRHRLLRLNPYSLFRPFATWDEALKSPDIKDFLTDLRRQFPPHKAEKLLEGLRGQDPASSMPGLPAVSKPQEKVPSSLVMPEEPAKLLPLPPAAPPVPEESLPLVPESPAPEPTADRKPAPKYTEPTPRRPSPYETLPTSPPPPPPSPLISNAALSWILFFVILVLGAGIFLYTLLRPFMP